MKFYEIFMHDTVNNVTCFIYILLVMERPTMLHDFYPLQMHCLLKPLAGHPQLKWFAPLPAAPPPRTCGSADYSRHFCWQHGSQRKRTESRCIHSLHGPVHATGDGTSHIDCTDPSADVPRSVRSRSSRCWPSVCVVSLAWPFFIRK
jgi:hypothetical protein